MCLCLSQGHVIVLCFCHFWNDNTEHLGYFPMHFFVSFRRPHTDRTTNHTGEEMESGCRCEQERDRVQVCYSSWVWQCLCSWSGIWESSLTTEIRVDQRIQMQKSPRTNSSSFSAFRVQNCCSKFPVIHWRYMSIVAPSAVQNHWVHSLQLSFHVDQSI